MSKKNVLAQLRSRFKSWFYGILVLFWAASAVIAITAVGQADEIEVKIFENNIVQNTVFDYKLDVIPCTLYPAGGTITPEGPVFTNITRSIRLKLTSNLKAEDSVEVDAEKRVLIKIVAEDYWERDYMTCTAEKLNLQGMDICLLDEELNILPGEINNYVKKVEEEIQVRPSKYYLKIKPLLTGKVKYKGEEIPIDESPELSFEIRNGLLLQQGEKEYLKESKLERINRVHQDFNLFGVEMPLAAARYLFSLIALFGLLILLNEVIQLMKRRKSMQTEAQKIDKRYHNRIVDVKNKVSSEKKNLLVLESFKALIRIADERELPILRYKHNIESVTYYVADGIDLYLYNAKDLPQKPGV